jgi:hypothetical protein
MYKRSRHLFGGYAFFCKHPRDTASISESLGTTENPDQVPLQQSIGIAYLNGLSLSPLDPIPMKCAAFALLLACICFIPNASDAQSAGIVIEVSAGDIDRIDTPIHIPLPNHLPDSVDFNLQNTENNNVVPGQRFSDDTILFILDAPLPAGSRRRYLLTTDSYAHQASSAAINDQDGKLAIEVDGLPVLDYHTAVVAPPEGTPAYYRRSGFIHPLYAPDGQILTDGFPVDHLHQHGIFFAWTNTTFRGNDIDFWNQQQQRGTISHEDVEETESGPVFARFKTRLNHLDLTGPDTVAALNEWWTVTVYRQPHSFLLDLESTQQTAGADTLHLNEYHYGAMGFRGSGEWIDTDFKADPENPTNYIGPGQGGFLTSEGHTRIDGNHTRPVWVDTHGKVSGDTVGVTIMGHPDNFRFPQPIRIHPTMPYFCFAPNVLGSFDISPGDTYRSQFRYYVHTGPPNTDRIEQIWQDYSNPPTVTLIP